MKNLNILIFLFIGLNGLAQDTTSLNWYDLSKEPLEGRTRTETENPFQRFPDSLQTSVRKELWDLSLNPAGVNFRFATKTKNIFVKYQIQGKQAFPHMPATGVSGVDLYIKNIAGDWQWVKGNFHFADTIRYNFHISNKEGKLNEYMLYLPLYATLKWMKMGVDKSNNVTSYPVANKKPIVVYGTSIAQGACASRPGNAWTNILSRDTDIPILNFGFSGNGELEPEIIHYISQLEARAYILDCLPNFVAPDLNAKDAYNRLVKSVITIRKSHPETPIIITDHAGYPDGEVNFHRKKVYQKLNLSNQKAYRTLKDEGIKNIYLLTYEHLGLRAEDFVDGVHPTDGGMQQYSKAYQNLLLSVLE